MWNSNFIREFVVRFLVHLIDRKPRQFRLIFHHPFWVFRPFQTPVKAYPSPTLDSFSSVSSVVRPLNGLLCIFWQGVQSLIPSRNSLSKFIGGKLLFQCCRKTSLLPVNCIVTECKNGIRKENNSVRRKSKAG